MVRACCINMHLFIVLTAGLAAGDDSVNSHQSALQPSFELEAKRHRRACVGDGKKCDLGLANPCCGSNFECKQRLHVEDGGIERVDGTCMQNLANTEGCSQKICDDNYSCSDCDGFECFRVEGQQHGKCWVQAKITGVHQPGMSTPHTHTRARALAHTL